MKLQLAVLCHTEEAIEDCRLRALDYFDMRNVAIDKYLEARYLSDYFQPSEQINGISAALSWRFPEKTGISFEELWGRVISLDYRDYREDIAFDAFETEKGVNKQVFVDDEVWHPKLASVWKKIGLLCPPEREIPTVYSYYIIGNFRFWSLFQFFMKMIIQRIEGLESFGSAEADFIRSINTPQQHRLGEIAQYPEDAKERMRRVFGGEYFTMHPFVTERAVPAILATIEQDPRATSLNILNA
jgi:hypothetical protein